VDRLTLRAFLGRARISCLIAPHMPALARIRCLVMATSLRRNTVSRVMRALRSLGLARREGARGHYWLAPERPADGNVQSAAPAATLAGAILVVGHEPEITRLEPEKNRFEPEIYRFGACSSSSYLYSILYKVERKRTTTTTAPNAENNRIEPAKFPIEPARSLANRGKNRIADDDAEKTLIAHDAEKNRIADDPEKNRITRRSAGGAMSRPGVRPDLPAEAAAPGTGRGLPPGCGSVGGRRRPAGMGSRPAHRLASEIESQPARQLACDLVGRWGARPRGRPPDGARQPTANAQMRASARALPGVSRKSGRMRAALCTKSCTAG